MYDKEYLGEEASFEYRNKFNIQENLEALEARHYIELHQGGMHCFSLLLLKGDSCAQRAQVCLRYPRMWCTRAACCAADRFGLDLLITISVQYVPCF